jgi:hypothetical protein
MGGAEGELWNVLSGLAATLQPALCFGAFTMRPWGELGIAPVKKSLYHARLKSGRHRHAGRIIYNIIPCWRAGATAPRGRMMGPFSAGCWPVEPALHDPARSPWAVGAMARYYLAEAIFVPEDTSTVKIRRLHRRRHFFFCLSSGIRNVSLSPCVVFPYWVELSAGTAPLPHPLL